MNMLSQLHVIVSWEIRFSGWDFLTDSWSLDLAAAASVHIPSPSSDIWSHEKEIIVHSILITMKIFINTEMTTESAPEPSGFRAWPSVLGLLFQHKWHSLLQSDFFINTIEFFKNYVVILAVLTIHIYGFKKIC